MYCYTTGPRLHSVMFIEEEWFENILPYIKTKTYMCMNIKHHLM